MEEETDTAEMERDTKHRKKSFYTAVICLMMVLPFSLWGEGGSSIEVLNKWFETNKSAAPYKSEKEALQEIFLSIAREELPLEPLLDKLNEGVSKKIPQERLTEALSLFAGQMIRIKEILKGLPLKDSSVYGDTVKKLSLYLSSGLDERIITGLRIYCFPADRNIGREERFLPLCELLFTLSRSGTLEPEEWLSLGISIGESVIPVSKYQAIVSLYMKGRVHRMTDGALNMMIIDILNKRGGIIQLSNELNRRTRER